jgi:hypothetical protein
MCKKHYNISSEITLLEPTRQPYIPLRCGKYQQEINPEAPSVSLTQAENFELQEIVVVFLFDARAVDPTMLTAITQQDWISSGETNLVKEEGD